MFTIKKAKEKKIYMSSVKSYEQTYPGRFILNSYNVNVDPYVKLYTDSLVIQGNFLLHSYLLIFSTFYI